MTNEQTILKFEVVSKSDVGGLPSLLSPEGNPEEKLVAGYISTFGLPADAHGDIFDEHAFDESIAKFAKGLKTIPLLNSHNDGNVDYALGKAIKLFADSHGLWAVFKFTDAVKDNSIYTKLKEGTINRFSVGVRVRKSDMRIEEGPDGVSHRRIMKAELDEASLVIFPANEGAVIALVKKLDTQEDTMTPEQVKLKSEYLERKLKLLKLEL